MVCAALPKGHYVPDSWLISHLTGRFFSRAQRFAIPEKIPFRFNAKTHPLNCRLYVNFLRKLVLEVPDHPGHVNYRQLMRTNPSLDDSTPSNS